MNLTTDKTSFCQFQWLGQVDYPSAARLQLETAGNLRDPSFPLRAEIFGLEHPALVTLGRRAAEADEVLAGDLPAFKIDRGGYATIHSPGQLVIYPIVDIQALGFGVRDWVKALIEVSVRTLTAIGVPDASASEDGVFTPRGKMVSVGLRIDQGISRHGIAINVSNDLALFNQIRVCGQAGRTVDRVAEYCPSATSEAVFEVWQREFIDFLKVRG